MKKMSSMDLAKTYARAAFGKCVEIVMNGQDEPITYRCARVGVGDGLWVGNDGLMYVQRHGRFTPSHLIPSLFSKMGKYKFTNLLNVPDKENNGRFKPLMTKNIGNRSLAVGQDGTLYRIIRDDIRGVIGLPMGSSVGETDSASELYDKTYETARFGYDPSLLQIAREHIGQSDLSDAQKVRFNSKLDKIMRSVVPATA